MVVTLLRYSALAFVVAIFYCISAASSCAQDNFPRTPYLLHGSEVKGVLIKAEGKLVDFDRRKGGIYEISYILKNTSQASHSVSLTFNIIDKEGFNVFRWPLILPDRTLRGYQEIKQREEVFIRIDRIRNARQFNLVVQP